MIAIATFLTFSIILLSPVAALAVVVTTDRDLFTNN